MATQIYSKILLFWLLWTLSTGIGALGVGLVWLMFVPFVPAYAVPLILLLMPLLTTLIGFAQWLVIRSRLSHRQLWIPASIPGGLILFSVALYDRTYLYSWHDLAVFFSAVLPPALLLVTCLVGWLSGLCQWLVLRRGVTRARWWPLISLFCLGIGWPFGEAVGETLGGFNALWPIVLGWTFTAFLSGLPLAWLIGRSSQRQPGSTL